jgi:Tfp pilus assembly protein PilN
MAKTRQKIMFGAAPRADLLPVEQRQELQHERTMPKLLLAIVASAAVAGLVWAAGMVPTSFADQRLADAELESEQLLTELATYSELQETLRGVEARSGEAQKLMANEVLYMDLLDSLLSVLPAEASIVQFSGTSLNSENSEPAEATTRVCQEGDTFVGIQVQSPTGLRVAELLEAIAGLEGHVCAEAIESSGGGAEAGMSLTTLEVVFDETVKSERFAVNQGGAE